jgi:hypothetical protein
MTPPRKARIRDRSSRSTRKVGAMVATSTGDRARVSPCASARDRLQPGPPRRASATALGSPGSCPARWCCSGRRGSSHACRDGRDQQGVEVRPMSGRRLDGFAQLVQQPIDRLADEFQALLEHVAVIVSDRGSEVHAYGQYSGDGIAPRRLARPDRDLPGHARAGLRARRAAAGGRGGEDAATRARAPARLAPCRATTRKGGAAHRSPRSQLPTR